MSLYIGNLSPRVRKGDLERVFQRFGRCTIQLKDGYGFAVYGIRAQADMALRALRGRNICGLPISLSWSNKQPTSSLQTLTRGARAYEVQRRRDFNLGDGRIGVPLDYNARRFYRDRQPDTDVRRHVSNSLHAERGSFGHDLEDQERKSHKDECEDENDNADGDKLDPGRWGEISVRFSSDNHIDDGTTFDRYEPDRDYEKIELEEGSATLHDMSSGRDVSERKFGRGEVGDVAQNHHFGLRKSQSCFTCGNLGHKMRDCPFQDIARKRKPSRSSDRIRRDGESATKDRGGRMGSDGVELSSRGQSSSTLKRQRASSRRDSGSGRHGSLKEHRSSPMSTGLHSDHEKAHGRRWRGQDGTGTLKDHHSKRTKKPVSRSRPRSLSASSSLSGSTSGPWSPHSSASSMSDSKSPQSKYESLEPEPKPKLSGPFSRSPTPLSPSVSVGQPVPSSSNKTEVTFNGSLDILTSQRPKVELTQSEVIIQDNIVCGHAGVTGESNSILFRGRKRSEVVTEEENVACGAIQDENMDEGIDVEGGAQMDMLQDDDSENVVQPTILSIGNSQHTDSLGNLAGYSSPKMLGGEWKPLSVGEQSYLMKEPGLKISSSNHVNHISIPLNELDRVVKHYDLKHTEVEEGHLSTEDYFGCARAWPWGMVYYRRLKKGPISTDNYARRLAQNKEFGITDKYVRSSSGWWEPTQGHGTKDFASS